MRRFVLLAVGTALLLLYLSRIELATLWQKAVAFPLSIAFLVVLLNGACGVVKTFRWTRFLRSYGVDLGFGGAYLAVHAAFFLGLVTPGTAGELARAATLRTDRDKGLAILVFEKLSDLSVLAVLVLGTVAFFVSGAIGLVVATSVVLGAMALAQFLWVRHRAIVLRPLKRLILRGSASEGAKGAERLFALFASLADSRTKVLASALYSLALWILSLVQVALLYRGLGVSPSWSFVALSYFLPYFIGVVSLVPLGLGTFEVSLRELVHAAGSGISAQVAAVIPAFFRLFVSIPLIAFGYGCQVALTIRDRRRTVPGAG